MKGRLRKISGIALSLFLLASCLLPAVTARAAENIGGGRARPAEDFGIVEIRFAPEGVPKSGILYYMYQIGSFVDGKYTLPEAFKGIFDDTADSDIQKARQEMYKM